MASNYGNGLYKDYEKALLEIEKLKRENKMLLLRAQVSESEQQRLEKLLEVKEQEKQEQAKAIEALKSKILELSKQLDITKYERDNYLSKLNNDGTNSGTPTSQTPINKKKVVPNSRVKSGKKIGGQLNHPKSKLERFEDEEINENVYIELEECPKCHCKELSELESEVTKDEFDYEIRIVKRRYHFKEYECKKCHKIVRKNIPVNLKEDNQYGCNIQAKVLTLINVGNVTINKAARYVHGITLEQMSMSEGYIAKLERRAALKLEQFIKDLKFYITHLSLVYWDDTVIMIDTHRACMRFYGNEDVALYCAHEKKDKDGLDKDNILNLLTNKTVVEHDHNIVNYNKGYSFVNAECCQHLLRDLQKVSDNLPTRTWSGKLKKLFQEYNHKRKLLIEQKIDRFNDEEFYQFIHDIDEYILLGIDEYLLDSEAYYADKELALINRLIEYRDNYVYWAIDFDLPFSNNLSERGLRYIKSKMKVSGQFQNIETATDYAIVNSYIETCHRNGINEYDCLCRLLQDNPYTLEEILEIGKQNAEKRA